MSLRHHAYISQKLIQHLIMRNIIPLNKHERCVIKNGPRIFANSIPKSGTHLLRHILSMMPSINDKWTYHYDQNVCDYNKQLSAGKNGQIISAHMYWSQEFSTFLEQTNYKVFLMVRDLRDVCVSSAHYCAKDKRHRLNKYFNDLETWSERLSATIEGIDADRLDDDVRSKSIADHVNGYIPWVRDDNCLVIKFEELVGTKGGGNIDTQIQTLHKISNHIGFDLSESKLAEIADKSFTNKTKTFRSGQIGGWRQEFDEKNISLFKKIAGYQLIELGYEHNNDWL